jgi:hypothetical protein
MPRGNPPDRQYNHHQATGSESAGSNNLLRGQHHVVH